MFEMLDVETFDVGTTDSEMAVIPEGLDEMVPGPFLAAILSATDVSVLSGFDRVVVFAIDGLRRRTRLRKE